MWCRRGRSKSRYPLKLQDLHLLLVAWHHRHPFAVALASQVPDAQITPAEQWLLLTHA